LEGTSLEKATRSLLKKRKAFTLIEVMVALAILMIVIFALLGNFYSYYSSVKQTMYKNVGQNLAELLLEDTRNLGVSILDSLVEGGSIQLKYYGTSIFILLHMKVVMRYLPVLLILISRMGFLFPRIQTLIQIYTIRA